MYYIKRKGKILGPLPLDKLKDMVAKEMLCPEHNISEDKVNWVSAGDNPQLFPAQAAAPAARQASSLQAPQDNAIKVNPPASGHSSLNVRQPDPLPVQQVTGSNPAPASLPPQNTYVSPLAEKAAPVAEKDQPAVQAEKAETEVPENVNLLAVLWDPVCSLPAIYQKYGDRKSLNIGLLYAAITLACLFFGFRNVVPASVVEASGKISFEDLFKVILFVSVPFISLTIAALIVRNIFGKKDQGGFGGDVLIAGAAYLPGSVSFLLLTFIAESIDKTSISPETGAMLITGLGLYVLCAGILTLFSGCSRISGIKENFTSFVIPIMIIISGIASYLIYQQILKK